MTGLLESGFLEKKKVTVSKLAIIGSPYQFNQEMFDDFQKWKHRLGKEVQVLNFVGSFAGKSDGIVPLSSAQAAQSIFDNQAYTEVNLNGRKAHHSALPTNPDLVKQLKSIFESIIKLHNFGYVILFVLLQSLSKYGTFLVSDYTYLRRIY